MLPMDPKVLQRHTETKAYKAALSGLEERTKESEAKKEARKELKKKLKEKQDAAKKTEGEKESKAEGSSEAAKTDKKAGKKKLGFKLRKNRPKPERAVKGMRKKQVEAKKEHGKTAGSSEGGQPAKKKRKKATP